MSESAQSAAVTRPPLQLVRLPVDKPQPAVEFLRARSGGVMDLIAHFWERLAHTPPLQRSDLHLVLAGPVESDNININIPSIDVGCFSGAMLYVPKAHRADVLALDPPTAAAFAAYIGHQGPRALRSDAATLPDTSRSAATSVEATPSPASGPAASPPTGAAASNTLPLTDLTFPRASGGAGNAGAGAADSREVPAEPAPATGNSNGRIPIDFLTGEAEGISWMTPLLLPLVHKRAPARQLVNVVMQLPEASPAAASPHVRLARGEDIPVLNRWRRQYKDERGILFDADMDAWIAHQRVFVYDLPSGVMEPAGALAGSQALPAVPSTVAAVAKIDLELQSLVEIGGVYTFPEHRNHGYGAAIVGDLAWRIRQMGKIPVLQVDVQNTPALRLYESAGWRPVGRLARVWLTG